MFTNTTIETFLVDKGIDHNFPGLYTSQEMVSSKKDQNFS